MQEAVQKLDAARRENEELMESVKSRRSSLGKAQATLTGHKFMLQTMKQAKQQLAAQANAPVEGAAASSASTEPQEFSSTSYHDDFGTANQNSAASPAAPGDSSSDDDDSSEERERQATAAAAAQLRASLPSTDMPFEALGDSAAPPPPLPSRRR